MVGTRPLVPTVPSSGFPSPGAASPVSCYLRSRWPKASCGRREVSGRPSGLLTYALTLSDGPVLLGWLGGPQDSGTSFSTVLNALKFLALCAAQAAGQKHLVSHEQERGLRASTGLLTRRNAAPAVTASRGLSVLRKLPVPGKGVCDPGLAHDTCERPEEHFNLGSPVWAARRASGPRAP